jgi:hypothetical protein
MPQPISEQHPLRQLFGTLVEQAFTRVLQEYEPAVLRYMVNLLTEFTHIDNIYRIRDARGRALQEVAEMLAEGDMLLNATSFAREREVHRHIGDFTLFWSGVYPEAMPRLRHALSKDALIDYVQQGKKSYYIVSTFEEGEWRHEAPLFRRLSERFELYMFGLNLVRQGWERLAREHFERWQRGLQ